MTEQEKRRSLYLPEGCYTFLENTQEHACVFLGPLHPSQLLSLCINNKIIVAHISPNSNVNELLNTIKQICPLYDSSKITGELFTNNSLLYNNIITDPSNIEKTFCLKKIYQNRTQIEELKLNKDKVIEAFNIKDRNQIKAYKFTSPKKDFELGNYELAELYVFIKMINNQPYIFNTCPMAEQYFGDFSHLPIEDRCDNIIKSQNSRPNPFYANQQPEDKLFFYGALPCHYIPYTISNN